jgi:hypothetical protein
MNALLQRLRGVSRRTLLLTGSVAGLIFLALVGVLGSPEELAGVLGLAAYVVAVLLLSAAITLLVVKISPAQSAKEQARESS